MHVHLKGHARVAQRCSPASMEGLRIVPGFVLHNQHCSVHTLLHMQSGLACYWDICIARAVCIGGNTCSLEMCHLRRRSRWAQTLSLRFGASWSISAAPRSCLLMWRYAGPHNSLESFHAGLKTEVGGRMTLPERQLWLCVPGKLKAFQGIN